VGSVDAFLGQEQVSTDESKDQAYYWTSAWQRQERLAEIDLTRGRVHSFDDIDAALAWLSSP
jgi:hypothetical protein